MREDLPRALREVEEGAPLALTCIHDIGIRGD
jgi:hypothetical protein